MPFSSGFNYVGNFLVLFIPGFFSLESALILCTISLPYMHAVESSINESKILIIVERW